MIHGLATRMASVFVTYGESSADDQDIYVYACELLVSTIINISLGLLISFLMGRPMEGIIFILGFVLIRRYAGGYHASTYARCILTFAVVLACGMLILSFVSALQAEAILMVVAGASCIGISLLAPVEHENKILNAESRKLQKEKSIWIVLVLFVFCLVDFFVLGTGIWQGLALSIVVVFGGMVCGYIVFSQIIKSKSVA